MNKRKEEERKRKENRPLFDFGVNEKNKKEREKRNKELIDFETIIC